MKRIAAAASLAFTLLACRTTSGPGKMPKGYVLTPNGLMHRSCVRILADGYKISENGVITSPAGERETLAPCPYPRLDPKSLAPITDDSDPEGPGWVISAGWTSPVPIGNLSATFVVPAAPSNPNSATIYLFPAITPGNDPIMQTDLGWHPDQLLWTINPAYCCPQGWRTQSAHLTVNTGDTIVGSIGRLCSGTRCDWLIVTTDLTTGQAATLLVENVTTPYVNAGGGALEAYQLTSCDQLPANGTISFTNITLLDQNGNSLLPDWRHHKWPVPFSCAYGELSGNFWKGGRQ